MADRKLEMAVEADLHSVAAAAGSTKTADVMIAWTTGGGLTKRDVVTAARKLVDQLVATDDSEF